jgi:YfiR/HmsC-like
MRDPERSPEPVHQKQPDAPSRRIACWRSLAIALLILLGAPSSGPIANAQSSPPSQFDVQAVYLFDFAKFVRWPAGAESGPIVLCIAAESRYAESLKKIVAGERIDNRALVVQLVQRSAEAGCHILFIGATALDRLDSLLSAAAGRPTLTVSDLPGFLDRGGMINLLVIDNRVRFAVDLRPVQRSGISLSSELLKVAVRVRDAPPGGGAL